MEDDTQASPHDHVAVGACIVKMSLVRLHLVNDIFRHQVCPRHYCPRRACAEAAPRDVKPITLSRIVGYNAEDDVTSDKVI
jgi:hypothetical protein